MTICYCKNEFITSTNCLTVINKKHCDTVPRFPFPRFSVAPTVSFITQCYCLVQQTDLSAPLTVLSCCSADCTLLPNTSSCRWAEAIRVSAKSPPTLHSLTVAYTVTATTSVCSLADPWPLQTRVRFSNGSASYLTYSYTFFRSVVCRLSHSCIVLKPRDDLRCNSAGTVLGSNKASHRMGFLTPLGKGRFWSRISFPLSQNIELQIACKPSVLCYHLANTSYERFRLLLNYFGSCWHASSDISAKLLTFLHRIMRQLASSSVLLPCRATFALPVWWFDHREFYSQSMYTTTLYDHWYCIRLLLTT